MKKLKINVKFVDKYTNKLYKVGETIEFEDDRAEELLKDPRELVEAVKTKRAASAKEN